MLKTLLLEDQRLPFLSLEDPDHFRPHQVHIAIISKYNKTGFIVLYCTICMFIGLKYTICMYSYGIQFGAYCQIQVIYISKCSYSYFTPDTF